VHIKFAVDDAFHRDIRARVERYLRVTGQSPRDCPSMYTKMGIVFAWLIVSYVILVFLAGTWWLALPAALSVALAATAVGFNVQHDGGHRSFSRHAWVNRWMARSLDVVGASSYMWDHKHNTLHHTYANIEGHDDDIDVGFFGRLAPEQRRLFFHRLQHLYLWGLYALLPLKWHVYDDFSHLARGEIAGHRFARPRGKDLAVFLGGKLLFFGLALGLPSFFHPFWIVLLFYVGITGVQGIILSVVFQLAHVVEEAEFPMPDAVTQRMGSHWAVHQVETTVDFSPGNPVITWYVGGLNYQIEHHLFPRVSHVHYPRIARIVAQACRRHGIRYNVHPTLWQAIGSHFRWLREMGRPVAA
jgi:linoleoyl-CoA desaturase